MAKEILDLKNAQTDHSHPGYGFAITLISTYLELCQDMIMTNLIYAIVHRIGWQ